LSLLAGAASGLLGAVFRLLLDQADRLRDALIAWAHGETLMGFLLVTAICTVATAVAAWLVRCFSPQAEGSGIPHVEAVMRGELPPAPYRLIPVKFLGGLLAIGSGLALGREGPSVQMGASTGHLLEDGNGLCADAESPSIDTQVPHEKTGLDQDLGYTSAQTQRSNLH
jgi:CIC family chloride channel protein